MKIFPFIALFCAFVLFSSGTAPKSSNLTINFKYINVLEGYDHDNKNEVWIDDDRANATMSSINSQTKQITMQIEVPRGKHVIHIVNFAKFEGKFEAHTKENNYSLDASVNEKFKFKKKKHTLNVVYDITSEMTSTSFK